MIKNWLPRFVFPETNDDPQNYTDNIDDEGPLHSTNLLIEQLDVDSNYKEDYVNIDNNVVIEDSALQIEDIISTVTCIPKDADKSENDEEMALNEIKYL
ncbi:unnamed protein product [Hermetia illucens]|uniref:Uncharacterized protein n=1 Tax=Hermetia illucens TaxID=343691 RepID=A0A7R8UQB1_HERIL|nr:unnamed protein product [Hermetia illucens]